MNNNLKMGSLLSRSKGILVHTGIYLGCGKVIHTVPETGISVVSIDEFSNGKSIKVKDVDHLDPETLGMRIKELFSGSTEYSLSDRNCQHVANYLISGKFKSKQLAWSVTCSAIAGLWALHRGYNPALFMVGGGVLGCLLFSANMKFDHTIPVAKSDMNITSVIV